MKKLTQKKTPQSQKNVTKELSKADLQKVLGGGGGGMFTVASFQEIRSAAN